MPTFPPDFDALKRLCERVVKLGTGGFDKFFQALESFIWRSLEKDENVRSLLPVLIHEGSSSKKPEADRGSISVFLDVPDWKEYPVAHEKTIKGINECLLEQAAPEAVELETRARMRLGEMLEVTKTNFRSKTSFYWQSKAPRHEQ